MPGLARHLKLFRSQPLEDVSTPGHGQGEGPDGDKWPKATQETLGGAGVSTLKAYERSSSSGWLRNNIKTPGRSRG